MERPRAPATLLTLGLIVAAACGCGGASGGSSTVLDSTAAPGAGGATGASDTSSGSGGPSGTTSPPPATTSIVPPPFPGPSAELRIRIWERGRKAGQPVERTLVCGGSPAGTVRDPSAACAQLAAIGRRAFAPTSPDMVCTEIYGGASEAVVEGTLEGQPVAADYSLRNGCEIARWDRLSTILAAHSPTPTNVTP